MKSNKFENKEVLIFDRLALQTYLKSLNVKGRFQIGKEGLEKLNKLTLDFLEKLLSQYIEKSHESSLHKRKQISRQYKLGLNLLEKSYSEILKGGSDQNG